MIVERANLVLIVHLASTEPYVVYFFNSIRLMERYLTIPKLHPESNE
jgi:hypothetical protein